MLLLYSIHISIWGHMGRGQCIQGPTSGLLRLAPPVKFQRAFLQLSIHYCDSDSKELPCNATHPVRLPGESEWTEEPGGLPVNGVIKSQT